MNDRCKGRTCQALRRKSALDCVHEEVTGVLLLRFLPEDLPCKDLSSLSVGSQI